VCFVAFWHDLARFGVFVTGFLCAPAFRRRPDRAARAKMARGDGGNATRNRPTDPLYLFFTFSLPN